MINDLLDPQSAAPSAALRASLAGRYWIERELGRGGHGHGLLGPGSQAQATIALKVIHPEKVPTLSPQRFRREIELAARLQYPHILGVHDSDEADGHLWFTMPYVKGRSLRERLRLTLHVRHDVVEQPLRATGVEERDDVGMLQAGGELDLFEEALGAEYGGELGSRLRDPSGPRSGGSWVKASAGRTDQLNLGSGSRYGQESARLHRAINRPTPP